MRSEAWFVHKGPQGEPTELVREDFEISPLNTNEVLVAPLYGCWEGNMGHALERKPIDICSARGEDRVVMGNAAVVEVLETGEDVKAVRSGQKAIIFCTGIEDWFGYPEKIYGYDAPGTIGCLATRTKVLERQLIPIPENSVHSLQQWAAFSLRYITAWSNWEIAYGTYRLMVGMDELASINVWGWGGGVTLAELDLARRHGCKAVMLSGTEHNLRLIEENNIRALDRRQFGNISNFDPVRYKNDKEFAESYKENEKRFLAQVVEMTQGRKVQIFVDMIGAPAFRATLKALSRNGVITTSGWKEGMQLKLLRAVECIERHQHIHTHYARYPQGWKAVAFAEGNGWMAPKPTKVYSYDDVPQLAKDYDAGKTDMFPIFAINAEAKVP